MDAVQNMSQNNRAFRSNPNEVEVIELTDADFVCDVTK